MPTSLVSTGVQFPDSTIQTTAASASALVLVNSQSLSGASSYTLTTGISSTYDNYFFTINALTSSSAGSYIAARFQKSGSVQASGYINKGIYAYYSSSLSVLGSYSNYIVVISNTYNNAPASVYGYLLNVNSTTPSYTQGLFMTSIISDNVGGADFVNIGGSHSSNATITGLNFYQASGSNFTGTFKLYGIAKS